MLYKIIVATSSLHTLQCKQVRSSYFNQCKRKPIREVYAKDYALTL